MSCKFDENEQTISVWCDHPGCAFEWHNVQREPTKEMAMLDAMMSGWQICGEKGQTFYDFKHYCPMHKR